MYSLQNPTTRVVVITFIIVENKNKKQNLSQFRCSKPYTTASQPTLFSFSAIINTFARSRHFHHVLGAFSQMGYRGIVPDGYLLPSAIKACAALQALKPGKQVHGFAFVSGYVSDSILTSSLVHMYLKCNQIEDAQKLFDEMPERDVIVWSAMIAGYSRQGLVDKAKEMFSDMQSEGVEPNLVSWNGMIAGFSNTGSHDEALMLFRLMLVEGFLPEGSTVSCILPAIGNMEDVMVGAQVHGYVLKQGLESDKFVVSSLIDMYGRCGRASEMSRVFDEVDQMEIGSLNAFLTGLSRNGLVDTALEEEEEEEEAEEEEEEEEEEEAAEEEEEEGIRGKPRVLKKMRKRKKKFHVSFR